MRYIRSAPWDGFWIAGGSLIGVALAVYALIMPPVLRGPWSGWPLDWRSWSIAIVNRHPSFVEMIAVWVFMLGIVVDTAHILSPMVLTWTDARLGREALVRWRAFLFAPTLAAVAALSIGIATSAGWTDYVPGRHKMFYLSYQLGNPFPVMVLGYVLWQIYHFGSQNFGLVMIYRRWLGRSGHRTLIHGVVPSVTAALIVPSYLVLFRVPQKVMCPGWNSCARCRHGWASCSSGLCR
jgi:hypothetical protein